MVIPQWVLLGAIIVVALCLIGGLIRSFWPRRPASHRIRPRSVPQASSRAAGPAGPPRGKPPGAAASSGPPLEADPRPQRAHKPQTKLPPPPAFFSNRAPKQPEPSQPLPEQVPPMADVPSSSSSPSAVTFHASAPPIHPEPEQVEGDAFDHSLRVYRRLWEAKRYQELLTQAEPDITRLRAQAEGGHLQAQAALASLYGLIGFARQAMSDDDGAKEAFHEAIHWAPAHDRPTYQQQLVSLVGIVGRRFLQRAERTKEEEEVERIQALKQAIAWLKDGVAVHPEDPELTTGLERARRGLLASYGRVATAMIERQEFHGARRLLREALNEDQIPAERHEVFLDLIAATFAGEIGILAANAVRALEDGQETEAVALFQRAENVLSSVPEDAIRPQRRDEINRRFWWGYTKLGIRRLQDGRIDAAIDPLLRAIKISGIDPDRQQETRHALVEACRDLLDTRARAIQELIAQGRTADAQLEGDRLRVILEDGIRNGISPEDFGRGFDQFRELMLRLGLPVA